MTVEWMAPAAGPDGANRPKTAILVSYSAIPDDPRVRRMGDFLSRNGWDVVGFGLPGARSPSPSWPVFERVTEEAPVGTAPDELGPWPSNPLLSVALAAAIWPLGLAGAAVAGLAGLAARPFRPELSRSLRAGALRWADPRKGGRKVARILGGLFFARTPQAASALMRRSPALVAIQEEVARNGRPGVWVANDWLALPIAAEGVRRHGGVLVYDSHEFATEEYAERLDWRLFQRPIVRTIEARFIRQAAVVTAVSQGIADELGRIYRLKVPVFASRNMPPYEACDFRPVGERIKVLYHGVVAPGRGLHETLESVPLWRSDRVLTIRGPASPPDYMEGLIRKAEELGVSDRVTFEAPIPTSQLARAAAEHDIGFFALPGHSKHNEYALPNKVFEYMMGGLALILSDLTEMRRIIETYRTGVLLEALTPQAIAATVNGITREEINAYKRAALEAAKELHWDRDAERTMDAYARALASTGVRA